jgi:hypothetical protein
LAQENLRFLQRVPPVVPQRINVQKQMDCESTNSGSGNELVKPKNFDFLKKRKEAKDQEGQGPQSLRLFQQIKGS